uniref:Metalloendopeptidase n=2 Tax=Clytia hemisphaerica TaxID=252671 RepID=A0A7M5X7W7_9CNID
VIESVSCVRFVKRTTEKYYVNFFHGTGCWSSVGRIGPLSGNPKQQISIDHGCEYQGVIVHEILHALSFYHEQSRADRTDHIIINWDNVAGGRNNNNFFKHGTDYTDYYGSQYDTQSLMQYGNYAFAKDNDFMTIISKRNPTERLGQRQGLSETDILKLNNKYQCHNKHICTDQFSICSTYPKFCDDSRWPEFKKNCPVTCKICDSTTTT